VRHRIEPVIGAACRPKAGPQVQIAESNLARIHLVARLSRASRRASTAMPQRQVALAVPPGRRLKRPCSHAFDEPRRCACSTPIAPAFPPRTPRISGERRRTTLTFLERRRMSPSAASDILRPDPPKSRNSFSRSFASRRTDSDLRPVAHARDMGLKVLAEQPTDSSSGKGRPEQDLELLVQATCSQKFEESPVRSRAHSPPCDRRMRAES